jgi:hypothetical protein
VKGFIKRYILHLEWHRGYKPHFSIRRMPRQGDRVTDAGITGTLRRCPTCSGQGTLIVPDPDQIPGIGLLRHSPEVGVFLPSSTSKFLDEVNQGLWRAKARMTEEGLAVDMEKQHPSQETHGS